MGCEVLASGARLGVWLVVCFFPADWAVLKHALRCAGICLLWLPYSLTRFRLCDWPRQLTTHPKFTSAGQRCDTQHIGQREGYERKEAAARRRGDSSQAEKPAAVIRRTSAKPCQDEGGGVNNTTRTPRPTQ